MSEADYEAKRARLEREAGLRFSEVLREQLEARRIPVQALTEPEEPEDGDDAA
jgi:hypothetical protein